MLLVGYTGAGSYPQCWENYTDEEKINVFLAGRNLKNIEVVSPLGINPYNLMKYNNVVVDSKILDKLQVLAS